MKQSIYPQESQTANRFFAHALAPEKCVIVPMDFAKKEHTAQFCRGTGELLLKKPLIIYNDVRGADYLDRRIQGICRKYHISKKNILIGGEDPPPYVYNFIHCLQHDYAYAFVRVNAHQAKKFRNNTRASSDNLDLNGIGQSLINRRALDIADFDQIYANLKRASRSRRKFVTEETSAKNRIHSCVDILFPGFLNEQATSMVPFSNASLWLMEENFSVIKINHMRFETLVKGLQRHRTNKPEDVAKKLKALAKNALSPAPELIPYHTKSLSTKVNFLRAIRESIRVEENEMARYLIQTPAFYLTSIPGIGIVLAAGITAEYGNTAMWRVSEKMASYAGIVPREKQSGGSDNAPVKGHLPLDCNHILKDYLLQAAYHVGTTPHPMAKLPERDGAHRLFEHYQRIENRQGKSRLSTAKLLLRIARRMVINQHIYVPSQWLKKTDISGAEFVEYFDCVNASFIQKWKGYDLTGISPDKNYFTKWKDYTDELKHNSTSKN